MLLSQDLICLEFRHSVSCGASGVWPPLNTTNSDPHIRVHDKHIVNFGSIPMLDFRSVTIKKEHMLFHVVPYIDLLSEK